uniref:Tubulin--tyrosine ligase-like protein 9 n=1 Tax=Macrostomum lignano TaxID=282301 RepID=A0A1I8HR71_9PLAT
PQVLLDRLAEAKRYSRLTRARIAVPFGVQPRDAPVRVDTTMSHTNLDVVRLAIKQLGWRECPSGGGDPCEICWNGLSYAENPGGEDSCVNRFPGIGDLLHKSGQPAPCYIVKPDAGAQGGGIYLIRSAADYSRQQSGRPLSHIVQTYLDSPLLLDGYKFDLRLYVLLLEADPTPRVFICRDGLARFCTQQYAAPNADNLGANLMHLTNYSINKRSRAFVHGNAETGSKRTFSSVLRQLAASMGDSCDVLALRRSIERLCVKTTLAVLPELLVNMRQRGATVGQSPRCFQILGFDVLILSDLTPVLLEVNSCPSLRLDYEVELIPGVSEYFISPVDVQVKQALVRDSLATVERWMLQRTDQKATKPAAHSSRSEEKIRQNQTAPSNDLELDETENMETDADPGTDTNNENDLEQDMETEQPDQGPIVESEPADSACTIGCMTEIFPGSGRHFDLQRLRVLEGLADLFLTACGGRRGCVKLGATAFRGLARKCSLQRVCGLSMADANILYIDLQRRWEYLSSDPTGGICFQAFAEGFFKMAENFRMGGGQSRRDSASMLDKVSSLLNHCCDCMGLGEKQPQQSLQQKQKINHQQQLPTLVSKSDSNRKRKVGKLAAEIREEVLILPEIV